MDEIHKATRAVNAGHTPRLLPLALALWLGLQAFCATAEPDAGQKRERELLRRIQGQVAQANDEKARLEQALTAEKAAGEKLKKELAEAARSAGALKGANRSLELLKKQLEEETAKLRAATEKAEDLARGLTAARGEVPPLKAQLQAAAEAAAAEKAAMTAAVLAERDNLRHCKDRNASLYGVGTELLERYRNKGVFDALLSNEPFTRLKRVQLENLVQDYKESLQTGRIAPQVK